ncbi:MAG: MFS transporter [Candidatus Saccharimonadaceae bacterium]
MLRMTAMYIAGSFMSIYLYQLGYGIVAIGLYWSGFFIFKTIIALPVARFIAWVGPKHSILISNLLYIPSMIAFALLPQFGGWILLVSLFFQAVSATMYTIAYLIDFSKVKSIEHAGKEIAYMNIFEKVTTGLSPLIGGFIAFIFGPQVVIIIAAILFALAAVPLLKSGEQVRINQKLKFHGFPWHLIRGHALAQFAAGFDVFTSGTAWSLYVAVMILGLTADSNEVYAITGVLVSVVFIVAILASYTYGRIIDKKQGGYLMKAGTIANAFTHLIRPFIVSPVSVAGLNAANELATTGYVLPYTRAMFDNADISGARVAYLGMTEMLSNFGAGMAALLLATVAAVSTEGFALKSLFFVTGAVVLLVLTARFPLYKK